MKWLLTLSLVLSACGQDPVVVNRRTPPPHVVQTNDDLVKQYVEEFYQRCVDQNNQTCLSRWRKLEYVKFVDEATIRNTADASNRVGVCYTWTDDKNRLARAQIQLLEGEWDEKELEGLVYHELGHCALGLDHTEGTDDHPTMMNPYMYDASTYLAYWDQMVDELFAAVLNLFSADEGEPTGKLTKKAQE